MTEIKAVFFDIDGTLVPFGCHEVPENVRSAIQKVRRKGIKVFIASGRHIEWIDNLGDSEFDGYITSNGSLCLESDKKSIIYARFIDSSDIERLIEFSEISDLSFTVIPKEGNIFTSKNDKYVGHSAEMLRLPIDTFLPLDNARGKEIVQLMAYGPSDERENSGLFTEVLRNCSTTSWNDWFCDIIPSGGDKSVGMDRIMEYFGIDSGKTLAFGDGSNDIGMIRHADFGIAMGNASDDVKAAADYVTADILDDGVIKALRHFGILD